MKNLRNLFFGGWLYCFGFFVLGLGSSAFPQRTADLSANELIQKLMTSERQIHDVEVRYDYILEDGFVLTRFDWGYEGGKEYYAGYEYRLANAKKDAQIIPFEMHVGFDGEKLTRWGEGVGYGDNNEVYKADDVWGRVASFEWSHFPYPTPNKLLGYDVSKGRRSFGEVLRDAQNASIKSEAEIIDGHPCQIVEAIGVADRTLTIDIRAWIDTERDCRPLKIEIYRSIGGNNRWQVMRRVIENIKLEKVDGVWFPIEGQTCAYLIKDVLPPKGMSEKEFKLLDGNKALEVAQYVLKPQPAGTVKIKVDKKTIRINRGIDQSKFVVEFPQGCKVYDDFLQSGYTVGEPNPSVNQAIMDELLNSASVERSRSDSPAATINVQEANVSRNLPEEGTDEHQADGQVPGDANPRSGEGIQSQSSKKYLIAGVMVFAIAAAAIATMLIRAVNK